MFWTDYVATRWYRAPEIIMGWKKYTKPVDMWSCGCILGELLGRKPMFPGTDSQHQLSLITDLLGTPTEDDISNVRQETVRQFLRELEPKPVRHARAGGRVYLVALRGRACKLEHATT